MGRHRFSRLLTTVCVGFPFIVIVSLLLLRRSSTRGLDTSRTACTERNTEGGLDIAVDEMIINLGNSSSSDEGNDGGDDDRDSEGMEGVKEILAK